jgi:aspartyl-tRNA(Asn)/glutamyl-tRNA(Gln) amidotransferase subunit A
VTSTNDLTSQTVAELADRLRTKDISPVEVATAFIERADALEPKIGAFITRTANDALAAARVAEAEIVAGSYRGPLHGIPVGIKDIYWTEGVRTTSGSAVYADFVPDRDSTAVSLLRKAGASVIGKTGTCEFAFDPTGRNPHYGMPNNPWGLDRMPGGSSAGSGAAVAAGFAPIALGTDTGGSIRIPSALCGLTGIKPTYGLTSRYGVTPLSWTLDTVGPLARSALDAAIALNALVGYDPADPASVNMPQVDFTQGLDRGLTGVRIGVPKEYVWDVMDPEVEAVFRKAMTDLEELGAIVHEISIPELEWVPPIAAAVTSVEAAALYGSIAREQGDKLDQATRRRIESGMFVSGETYMQAMRARKLFERRMAAAFESVDLIATPTVPMPAPQQGQDVMTIGGSEAPVRESLLRDTRIFNVCRFPAVAMPNGFSTDGLPLSLQLAAPAFKDASALQAAYAYQSATDWHLARAAI